MISFRLLTEQERAEVQNRIKQVQKEIDVKRAYLRELEHKLEEGEWFLDPEVARQMWKEAEEIVKKDKGLFRRAGNGKVQ